MVSDINSINLESRDLPLQVLIVEDSPSEAEITQIILSRCAELTIHPVCAYSLSEALNCLSSCHIDLVLLDLNLPDSSGIQTFERIRQLFERVPIIILSGEDDESLAVRTLKQGAMDYLVKGKVDRSLLIRSIRYALERHKIEAELTFERDLLYALLNNIPDRIYFKDRDSRFIRISRALADLFKLKDPSEALGKTDFDFFTLEHAQPAFEDEQRIIKTGEPIIGLIEKETLPDNTVCWVITSKMPLKDKQGRIVGTFGISRDITNLKKMEDALASEKNLLRNLIDHLPDYIYAKDVSGRFILCNAAYAWLLGYSGANEIEGKTEFDIFPHALASLHNKEDLQIICGDTSIINREEEFTDRLGMRRWIHTTKVPFHDQHGKIIGLVCISRDITARRKYEEELKQLNADLQRANEALKNAQAQLIEAEKLQSIGRLAAGVAHEVKNPLATIRLGLDYIKNSMNISDKDAVLVLQDIETALNRATEIIHGLLDTSSYSRLELAPQDINKLLKEALNLAKREQGSGEVKVNYELSDDLPEVAVDSNKMMQVFINLLTNAYHAMPKGGILTLRTSVRKLSENEIVVDEGSRVFERFHKGETALVIEIEDTGHGITPDHLTKIFDPFFTTKPTGKGTGLGLTVSRKIVELHGGVIDVKNRPEGGARATIILKINE